MNEQAPHGVEVIEKAARTTVARSALWSARVLPDHWRETRTRRPPMPRVSRWWTLLLQRPAAARRRAFFGLDAVAQPVRAPVGARGASGVRARAGRGAPLPGRWWPGIGVGPATTW